MKRKRNIEVSIILKVDVKKLLVESNYNKNISEEVHKLFVQWANQNDIKYKDFYISEVQLNLFDSLYDFKVNYSL